MSESDQIEPYERTPKDMQALREAAPRLYSALATLVETVVKGNSAADLDDALRQADDALLEAAGVKFDDGGEERVAEIEGPRA